jgi:cytochrome oxidase assembly protein ShyY1
MCGTGPYREERREFGRYYLLLLLFSLMTYHYYLATWQRPLEAY